MKTFEQLFKEKLNEDIKEAVNEKLRVVITNDQNQFFYFTNNLQGNELIGYIVSGNGIRSVSESGSYISQSLATYFYTPFNMLQETLAMLNKYAIEQSQANNIQTVGDQENQFEFYINYNTPSTDGITRQFGEHDYLTVILMGSLIYSSESLNIDTETLSIEIDGQELTGIINHQLNFASNVEPISVEGQTFGGGFVSNVSNSISMRVIYNNNDLLHRSLKSSTIKGNKADTIRTVKIDNETYQALVIVGYEKAGTNFSYLNITINRLGD